MKVSVAIVASVFVIFALFASNVSAAVFGRRGYNVNNNIEDERYPGNLINFPYKVQSRFGDPSSNSRSPMYGYQFFDRLLSSQQNRQVRPRYSIRRS